VRFCLVQKSYIHVNYNIEKVYKCLRIATQNLMKVNLISIVFAPRIKVLNLIGGEPDPIIFTQLDYINFNLIYKSTFFPFFRTLSCISL
jgi:hypothetical protein